MTEDWRDVPGIPGFKVSSRGRIVGPRGRVLAGARDRDGYIWFSRWRAPRVSAHALVARAFHGPRPSGYVIDHIDGDRANNAPHNVRYCSHAENMARTRTPESSRSRVRQPTLPFAGAKIKPPRVQRQKAAPRIVRQKIGNAKAWAKITEAQAKEILALPRTGRPGDPNTLAAIGARYGIAKITVSDLLSGKTWKYLHAA